MIGPLEKNKAKCLHCGDILVSEDDFVECSCGRLRIGCGKALQFRTGVEGKDYKEMSVYNSEYLKKLNPNDTPPSKIPPPQPKMR